MTERRRFANVAAGVAAVLVVHAAVAPPAVARGTALQTVPGLVQLIEVFCLPGGTCLAVGETADRTGAVVTFRPDGARTVRSLPGTRRLTGITCAPGGDCVAVGKGNRSGVFVQIAADGTPGAIRATPGAPELYGVACPTATTCLATGSRYAPRSVDLYASPSYQPVLAVMTNGAFTTVPWYPGGGGRLWGISCASENRCLAVARGLIVVISEETGAWTATSRAVDDTDWSGTVADAIDCPSPAGCSATATGWKSEPEGHTGVAAMMPVSADGVPGPIQLLADRSGNAFAISCVDVGVCTVAGADNPATQGVVFDVRPATAPVATLWENTNYFTGVSCVTASSCGAIGMQAGIPPVPVVAWRY